MAALLAAASLASTLSKDTVEHAMAAVPVAGHGLLSSSMSEKASNKPVVYERKMGDSELSYYLPSRSTGVNDMYLHIGFRAPQKLADRSRIRAVWAILRGRHPLLCSKVDMRDYDDVKFVYTPPVSSDDALADADSNLESRTEDKDTLIESYLNGPRILSNNRVSYLIISKPRTAGESLPTPPGTPPMAQEPHDDILCEYHYFMCAAHFLGDGMALHAFANDFFGLLGSAKTQADLENLLRDEWQLRWSEKSAPTFSLPKGLEDNFVLSEGRFRRAAARIDFQLSQERLIGGHSFPKQRHETRHTIVPTVPFDAERTKKVLKRCKEHGVSISAALFSVCNIAWARMMSEKKELPMMMYSALNLRPYFNAKELNASYWFLAVGYFNVVLPTFLPSGEIEKTFWRRARSAKEQSTRAAKNPLVPSRSLEMARERGQRARAWGKEDDDKERGVWVAPPAPPSKPAGQPQKPLAPSAALIGLSLLGNLDGTYKHATFPDIQLHTLTTGSRQRQGGMLMFSYTFAGKLWVSLGYDENGFEKETVDKFWNSVLSTIDEFLG